MRKENLGKKPGKKNSQNTENKKSNSDKLLFGSDCVKVIHFR